MRPKVVMTVLLLALGLTGLLALLSKGLRPRTLPPAGLGDMVRTDSPAKQSQPEGRSGKTTLQPALELPIPPPVVSPAPTRRAESVPERIAELQALAMNDDTNSLNEILAELSNPDPQLRKGALEAVILFGGHAAIPRLQELAAQTEDTGEKADLLEAVDFLNLPSLMDYHPANPGGRKAAVNAAATNRVGRNPFQSRPATRR